MKYDGPSKDGKFNIQLDSSQREPNEIEKSKRINKLYRKRTQDYIQDYIENGGYMVRDKIPVNHLSIESNNTIFDEIEVVILSHRKFYTDVDHNLTDKEKEEIILNKPEIQEILKDKVIRNRIWNKSDVIELLYISVASNER